MVLRAVMLFYIPIPQGNNAVQKHQADATYYQMQHLDTFFLVGSTTEYSKTPL